MRYGKHSTSMAILDSVEKFIQHLTKGQNTLKVLFWI